MSDSTRWICACSVEAAVPLAFAWAYMTDVRNWNDPPATFALDGPFEAGTRGQTLMPGSPPLTWVIQQVDPGRGYTIESAAGLERAVMRVHWRFDAVSGGRSRLTQTIELTGENAAAHAREIRAAFEPNLEPGMQRIAGLMHRAATGER